MDWNWETALAFGRLHYMGCIYHFVESQTRWVKTCELEYFPNNGDPFSLYPTDSYGIHPSLFHKLAYDYISISALPPHSCPLINDKSTIESLNPTFDIRTNCAK
jgi:hypothetical protein